MSGAGGVDWGGLAEKGLGKAEEVWDEGKRKVGEGVDWATDRTGSVLERLDHHAVADVVEDWGDRTASSLGAKVGEQQLGQSEEADELIHGRTGDIAASVKNLRDFGAAFGLVGQGLKGLDSGHWKGEAAEAFRERFQSLPTDWLHAADAFEDAAGALETYAKTVTWAQGEAREAIALYGEGEAASRTAHAAWDKERVAHKESLAGDAPLPDPGEFTDPGDAKRKRAQEILAGARSQRDEVAGTARRAVSAALAHAPAEPSATERAKFNLDDFSVAQGVERTHMVSGIAKGTVGIVSFVRAVNPQDPYNLTHPAEYYRSVNMTLAGLASTAAHPDRALKGAWEALKADPTEFGGRLLPELATTKGAGAGLKAGLRAGVKDSAKAVATRPARKEVLQRLRDVVRRRDDKKYCGDPVDVATGRMVLSQKDSVLPGSLPLVFQRTFESSYRAGRWFGPTWASTVDQRLEIDSEGIVLVAEDGSLLAYPHPAPGVPVLPSYGVRWPLNREQDGYTVTDPGTGRVRHFTDHGEDVALLTQIDDRNGSWITFEYDEAGTPIGIVHHGGYHLKLTTAQGRITALHLARAAPDGTDQEILRYGYTDGHLTDITDPCDQPLRFGYDEHGRITSWTDTNGSRFDYVYDNHDRCTFQSGTDGHLRSKFTYDTVDPETGLHVTTVTNSLGNTTRFLINDDVQVSAEIEPTGAVTRYEHDRHNRLLTHTDPLGRVTRLQYDDAGRLTAVIRADGRGTTAEYNGLGLPTRVTNADRTSVSREYDARGNLVAITDPSGAVTRFTHNERGHATAVTDAAGNTTTVRCNAAGHPVEITDPLGAVTHYERDGFGRTVAVTDALGATTRMEWTLKGKLARRIAADGTEESWAYDGEGNCVSHVDASGAESRFEYTHFDLMTARTGPDGVRHEFEHDTELRLTKVLNPQGLTWGYTYDAAGRLISEVDFDNRALIYGYDQAGRLTARTDMLGQTVRYERDDLDRIVAKDAHGIVTTFAYDFFDQLVEAVGPDTTITYLRDRFGRLKSESVNGRTTTFDHDTLGRRISRTTPSGRTSSWTYDAAGQRSTLISSGRKLTFEYDAAGRERSCHIGETTTLDSTFDAVGRLTEQEVTSAGRSIQSRAYLYRADGNLTGIDDQLFGTRHFDLDAAGRVTAVHAHRWTEHYAYDEAGNQTGASWPTTHPGQEATGPRSYSGTSITRAGNIRYEHDELGRITLRQKTRLSRKPDSWRYTWDAESRLTSVTTPDGSCWRYRYDPLGRRIGKQHLAVDGETVLEQVDFTWDGTTLCEQTVTSAELPNPITLTWDYQGLRPVAQTERITAADSPQEEIDQRFFSIVSDLVGSPSELIDEQGEIAWHTRTTLWGTTTWNANATAHTPLRFPGQYHDPETGFHYNYFRYYDPETARYLSPDPLGLAPSPNPVAYVHNPHARTDPLGLAPYDNRVLAGVDHQLREAEENGKLNHYLEGIGDDDLKLEDYLMGKRDTPADYIDTRTDKDVIIDRSIRNSDGDPVVIIRGPKMIHSYHIPETDILKYSSGDNPNWRRAP